MGGSDLSYDTFDAGVAPVGTKRCTGCGQVKPIDAFYLGRTYAGGRRSRCKACFNAATKRVWERERDRRRAERAAAKLPRLCAGCSRADEEHLHLPLSRGTAVAIVDVGDGAFVAAFHAWTVTRRSGNQYVTGTRTKGGERDYLHRFLMAPPPGAWVDHVNRDGLDNRRSNLRLATPTQNAVNTRPRGGTSRYHGVSRARRPGWWRAYITVDGRQRSLGTHPSQEQAARARDVVALDAWGEFATLNFPRENHPRKPGVSGLSDGLAGGKS